MEDAVLAQVLDGARELHEQPLAVDRDGLAVDARLVRRRVEVERALAVVADGVTAEELEQLAAVDEVDED